MSPFRAAALAAAALALAAASPGARVLAGDTVPSAAALVEQCKSCHDQAVAGMQGTGHAGLDRSCASCHGNVNEHLQSNLEKGEPGPVVKFTAMKAGEVNKTCLECHADGHQANFAGGVHERRGVSCTSCHSVHLFKSQKAQLKTARDAETCYACQHQHRGKQLRVAPSHPRGPHELRQLPRRPRRHQAQDGGGQANEKCLRPHGEARALPGEHAPVRENCMSCHDPHGSNHEKLLQAKQPYLCQRCHLNTRHPGTLYDGRNTTAVQASASNRAVEHGAATATRTSMEERLRAVPR
jgi:DmsE family decaheme c-type cytochrome